MHGSCGIGPRPSWHRLLLAVSSTPCIILQSKAKQRKAKVRDKGISRVGNKWFYCRQVGRYLVSFQCYCLISLCLLCATYTTVLLLLLITTCNVMHAYELAHSVGYVVSRSRSCSCNSGNQPNSPYFRTNISRRPFVASRTPRDSGLDRDTRQIKFRRICIIQLQLQLQLQLRLPCMAPVQWMQAFLAFRNWHFIIGSVKYIRSAHCATLMYTGCL